MNKLVSAVVSDDNDALVFGANTQYRYMFKKDLNGNSKFSNKSGALLIKYTNQDPNMLVDYAHLLGSDYSFGIKGIGPKLATDILTFNWEDSLSPLKGMINWYYKKLELKNSPKWINKLVYMINI